MMKSFLIVLACALWEGSAYPYPYYGANMDSFSYGSNDRGMVMSRYYNPYYNPRSVGAGAGMAAFMFRPEQTQPQTSQYYLPDRRRQTQDNYAPPQQNEVYYPQIPDQLPEQQPERVGQPELSPIPAGTSPTELADPTERTEIATVKATEPELTEPEVEEVPEPPKRTVTKKKQVKRPVEEEDAEEADQGPPKMPTGAFFPMFFGWGGRSAGAPAGATAIANAFSTGRGGVATSHATAYGPPRPETKL